MKKCLLACAGFLSAVAAGAAAGDFETAAFQRAIDEAAARGGGRVVVPTGRYVVGQLDLRSNVELHLEKGAVLEGAVGLDNYRVTTLPFSEGTWSAVVSAVAVTNVAITGEGEIFGNGTAWPQPASYGGNQEGSRPRGIFFADCRGVRLSDFTLHDSACWGVVFKCCDGVDVRRLVIDSHANANNDGIDIEARNVVIADCDIDTGDDAICLKSNNPGFIVENVLVTNVTARSHCAGLKLGTASHGTMRNIAFVDCRTEAPRRDFPDLRPGRNCLWFVNANHARDYPGVGADEPSGLSSIAIENVDGGIVEDVTFRRISAKGSCVPIFIRGGTRTGRACGTPPSDKRIFRRLLLEDIEGESLSHIASSITGVEGCRVKDVTLRNVKIVCRGGGDTEAERTRPVPEAAGKYPNANLFGCILPAYGLYVRHVDGLQLDNVSFPLAPGTSDRREPIVFDDVCSTCSLGIPLPSANSRREISMSRERSIWSKSASIDSTSTRYEAACPFCVMRTGRCVLRTRPMYVERLLRHSENGTTSSEGRQRRMGISRTFGMAPSPVRFIENGDIVQYSAFGIKGQNLQIHDRGKEVSQ